MTLVLAKVKWLLILMYFANGGRDVYLEFGNAQACHAAAASINQMLEEHLIASGQPQDKAKELLSRDYICIPQS